MPTPDTDGDTPQMAAGPANLRVIRHRSSTDFRQRVACSMVWAVLADAYDRLADEGHRVADAVTAVAAIDTATIADAAPEALAVMLRDCVIARDHHTSAASTLELLLDHYARDYGLFIDIDNAVIVADEHLAHKCSAALDATLRWCRDRAALSAATRVYDSSEPASHLSPALAVPATRGQWSRLRRFILSKDISEQDCRTVLFLLAYLSWQTADLDLITDTPILVNSAQEIKPVLRDILTAAAEPNAWFTGSPSDVLHEQHFHDNLALLSDPDRAAVRARRAAILLREHPIGDPLWPEHLNRAELEDRVTTLRHYVTRLAARCDVLFDRAIGHPPGSDGLAAGIREDMRSLADHRARLHADVAHPDLLPLERVNLAHVLAAVEIDGTVPELILLGEHSKHRADIRRRDHGWRGTLAPADARLTDILRAHGLQIQSPDVEECDELSTVVHRIDGFLHSVAFAYNPTDEACRTYALDSARLEVLLVHAGLAPDAVTDIRGFHSTYHAAAALEGATHRDRETAWSARLHDAAEFTGTTMTSDAGVDHDHPYTDTGTGTGRLAFGMPPEHCLLCPAQPTRVALGNKSTRQEPDRSLHAD